MDGAGLYAHERSLILKLVAKISINLANKTNLVHNLFLLYLSTSARFEQLWTHYQQKKLCLCDPCYLLFCVDDSAPCIPESHPHRITSTKCRLNTAVSPDDGSIVARNVQRLTNILRINCTPSWFYLQDYTKMHGQRNEKETQAVLH
jgi:hypothetical protein